MASWLIQLGRALGVVGRELAGNGCEGECCDPCAFYTGFYWCGQNPDGYDNGPCSGTPSPPVMVCKDAVDQNGVPLFDPHPPQNADIVIRVGGHCFRWVWHGPGAFTSANVIPPPHAPLGVVDRQAPGACDTAACRDDASWVYLRGERCSGDGDTGVPDSIWSCRSLFGDCGVYRFRGHCYTFNPFGGETRHYNDLPPGRQLADFSQGPNGGLAYTGRTCCGCVEGCTPFDLSSVPRCGLGNQEPIVEGEPCCCTEPRTCRITSVEAHGHIYRYSCFGQQCGFIDVRYSGAGGAVFVDENGGITQLAPCVCQVAVRVEAPATPDFVCSGTGEFPIPWQCGFDGADTLPRTVLTNDTCGVAMPGSQAFCPAAAGTSDLRDQNGIGPVMEIRVARGCSSLFVRGRARYYDEEGLKSETTWTYQYEQVHHGACSGGCPPMTTRRIRPISPPGGVQYEAGDIRRFM
jgi:hypothetical protein